MVYINKIFVTLAVLTIFAVVCQAYPNGQSLKIRQKRADNSTCHGILLNGVQAALQKLNSTDPLGDIVDDLVQTIIDILETVAGTLVCLFKGFTGPCEVAFATILVSVNAAVAAVTLLLAPVLSNVCKILGT